MAQPRKPFRWVSPISETTFQNYVQRKPPVQHNNLDVLHDVLTSDGSEPQQESITRNITRDVPTARRMLRSATDTAISRYGMFDDRTRRLLSITENEENEDAYLRDLFTKGEVDDDRIRQQEISRRVNEQQLMEDNRQESEAALEDKLDYTLDGFGTGSNAVFREEAKQKSIYSPTKDQDANDRATADAYLNQELKANPEAYKDLTSLNQSLKDRNVPLKVREHAVELAKSRQREDIANAYIGEIAASPNAAHRPDYYTADVSKLNYEKVNEYVKGLQQQVETEAKNKLSDYRQQLDAWKKQNMPLALSNPMLMDRLNNQYRELLNAAKEKYDNQKSTRYEQLVPFNATDTQQLRSAMEQHRIYGKTPAEAASFLGVYHDRLLNRKLLQNPKLDRQLFEQLWQQVATEVVHTNGNKNVTKLGVLTTAQMRQGMLARMGNQAHEWDTAFGINGSNADKAVEEYDDIDRMKDSYVMPSFGATAVGQGAMEKVRYHGEKILGSIATLMASDEANDDEEARIKEKLSRKVKLTFDEQQFMDAMRYKEMMRGMTGRDNPYYQGGEAVPDMIPYTLQFILGNKAMSLAGFSSELQPVFRAAAKGKVLSKMARLGNVFRNTAEQLKQTAAITAMFPQMGSISTNQRMYVDKTDINGDGSIDLAFDKNDPLTSTLKGYSDAFFGNLTEQWGQGIDRGMIYMGKGIRKGATKVGLGTALARMDKAVSKLPIIKGIAGRTTIGSAFVDDNAAKGVREWMKLGRVNGVVGEYLEEEASRNLNNIFLGDNDGKVKYTDENGKEQLRDKTFYEKLQFADGNFLKTTGSSVLAYSLLSGIGFTGLNAATNRQRVRIPVMDENGRITGMEKIRVSKRAMEVINELHEKEELTPEKLSGITKRFKQKEADYLNRYGTNLIDKKNEQQELEDSKEQLQEQGVKPEELEKIGSLTQAQAIIDNRELIDNGYAEVNERGNVVPKIQQLEKDIKGRQEQLEQLKRENSDGEAIAETERELAKLSSIKSNYKLRNEQRTKELINLSDKNNLDDYLDRIHQLEVEIGQHMLTSDTHANSKALSEKKAVYSALYNSLASSLENEGADDVLQEMEQRVDHQMAVMEQLKGMASTMSPEQLQEHHQTMLSEQAKLDKLQRNQETLATIAEQLRLNNEAQQTSAERDEAIERLNAEEQQNLSGELTNTKPSENKQTDETLPPPPNVVNDGNGNLKPYQSEVAPAEQKDEESNAVPDGPLLLHTMVRYNEKGKIVGDKKAVKTMLEKSLDIPKEATLKVSFAGGNVTAEVTYKGVTKKYKLLVRTPNGLAEVHKDSLIIAIANDMMAIDHEVAFAELLEQQRKAIAPALEDPKTALITEVNDRGIIEQALLEVLPAAEAASVLVTVTDAAKKSGKTLGEAVLSIASASYKGRQVLSKEQLDGLGKAIPKMVDAYEQQLSNAGGKMSSDGPTIYNKPEGTVETVKPSQTISSEEAIRRISSINILQTVNEIENRQTELIAKALKEEFAARQNMLERDRNKIDEVDNVSNLKDIDAVIGNQQEYEQWLLSHDGVKNEYANSHSTYTSIRDSKSTDRMSSEQYETLETFRHMGLLTKEEVKGYVGSRLIANEGIHKAVLRLYATMLGNATTTKNDIDKLKEYNRLINKQRTNARIMDRIATTAATISRMVQAYNIRYALSMEGNLTKEVDEKAGPTVTDIATKAIKAIEEQVKEQTRYYQQLAIHNDMVASIPDYDGKAPKKPRSMDLKQADATVKAIAAYAIRLNGELLDDSAAINSGINDIAIRLANAISTVNKTVQEINKNRKGVAPMIGGLSIDSPALKGDTVEECLDAIIAAGGENARSARYLKGKSFGEVKLRSVSEQEFEQLLNKHGLNHNTVAFYDSTTNEILLNEVTGNHEQALLHELTHALTLRAIEEDKALADRLENTFNQLKQELQKKGLLDGSYGFSSATEFIAEYHANGAFARMVNQADSPSSTIGKLVDTLRKLIRRMVGLPESVSVHDRIIFLTDDLIDRSELLSSVVAHEAEEVKNHIYALEASGTPVKRNARAAFIQLMMAVDKLDKENIGTLSYVAIEDRIAKALASNQQLAIEAFAKAGYEYDGEISDAANELLDAMRENSLFRYEVIAYRIRHWSKQQLEQKAEYEAAANDAAASSEERFEAQQKAFNPIVKNIAKLLGQTRDNVEVQLMNRLKQDDITEAIFSESSYQLWLDSLDDEATVSPFDKALGVSLGQGWSYKSFVSAVSFYRACRLERHLKIMFDRDGNAFVDTVNSGAQVKGFTTTFSRHLSAFAANHTVFEFGSQNGVPSVEERRRKKRVNTYSGMLGMMDYVSAIRTSMADDYSKGRTTRMEEYHRELRALQNLTGIDANKWDMLLSSEGYDSKKILNVGGKRYARATFNSYRDYCDKLDKLRALFADGQQRTVEQVEQEVGVKLEGMRSDELVLINDYNGYYHSKERGFMRDQYPTSVMTNFIFSKLGRTDIEKDLVDNSEASLVAAATVKLTQLFIGNENERGDAVRSNIDQLAAAVGAKDTLVSSGFGVDNNRINGMVLNSSLHHIADDIRALDIRNGLTNFYIEKGKDAEPVVLNGMVDLNDRDNPTVYDKLNNRDYWRSQLVLFVNGKDSYYASMGVFSDKGRGLFIEAPKYSLTWNEDGSFAEHDELVQLFPDFDESLKYFLDKYSFGILPKGMGLTTEEERRVCTNFFVSFVRNIKDINEVFQGEGYKNLTDMVKRGAPVISPGYNPLANVEGGLKDSYSHIVISDIIDIDVFGNEFERANGIQFATRKWFDQLTNSVGEVYANTQKYGKLSSTKALTTGINRANGQRFLTKTNIICIDEMADRFGGNWATLRDFMYEHEIDTVSSPSGTKKNSHIPAGTEHLQKRLNKPGEKDKFDGAFDLFGNDPSSYTKDDVKKFLQPYYTNDLYVQQDLRHESISSWSKHSKQHRMNFVSIEGWSDVFENLINQQVQSRINVFNIQYVGARSEEEKKLVLANAIIDRHNMLTKPIRSMDDIAEALSSGNYNIDKEDQEKLLAIMNPNAQLSYPSIAKWVRTKLSSALRTGAIEVKVNRTATQELPDLNDEHIGYKIVDKDSWELSEAMSKLTKGTFKLRPRIRLAEASTSDGSNHMRQAQYFEIKDSIEQTLFDAIRYAYKLQDMFDLNEDGSIPELPKFDGSIHSNFRAHELRIEKQGGVRYIMVPGEPFITNRVPGSSLVSHSVVRLRKNIGGDVNYTVLNLEAQRASGSDFDGDARYNQLMQRDRNGKLRFDSSIAGINNQMVLVATQAYGHPANYDRITRPLDTEYANDSVDAIRKKRMDRASASERYGLKGKYHDLDPIGYEDARVKNAAGVTMKAIISNLNSAFSYLKYSKATQNEKSFKKLRGRTVEKEYSDAVYEKVKGMSYNGMEYFEFGDIVHDRFDIVKKVIENELNKSFDNAKDPKIEDQGITEATANLFVFMLSTSKSLRDAEIELYRELDGDISWARMKELLDGFFDRVTLEADAIFNYLNTPVVQDYIMLTRSSTVGNFLTRKKIDQLMKEKYEEIPGGIGQLELLQDLLMYAMDLSTVQKAVNASDTNMGIIADFIDHATAVSKILGNQLNYFKFDSKYGWDNPHSWLKGSMDSISLHAQVLYGDAMEYSETYINALNAAVALVGDSDRNEVTKSQRIAIGNAIGQALSCSVVYPEMKLSDLERVLVSVLTPHINRRTNAFALQLMLSGVPGSYRIASMASSLRNKPTDEELLLAKDGFRELTRNKVITINGKKYPMGEAIYLYQLMRYGNQSIKGGFMDIIGDETIASYSKKFVNEMGMLSTSDLKKIMTAAVAYASYMAMHKGRVAKSSWAKFFGRMGENTISGDEFDISIWGNDSFADAIGSIITEKESASIDRIPASMLAKLEGMGIGSFADDRLREVLDELKLGVLSDAIDSYIEKDSSTEPISRARVALKLIQNRKKNPIPEESYGSKEFDSKQSAITKPYPLAYMMGDAYQLNPNASVGRVFTFKKQKGYYVVTSVRVLNLSTVFDGDAIENWTSLENSSRDRFMSSVAPDLMAGNVLYQTSYRQITPEELAVAKANGGKLNSSTAINGKELPEQHKGKLIYATPTSGKSHLAEQYDNVYDMDDLIRQFLTDSGVRTEGMSNMEVGLALFKMLKNRTQKEREGIIRPLLVRVNAIKKSGGTVLTGNSFFLEDMPYSDFGGKLKRWVNEWYTSDNVERIASTFAERGESRAAEYATKLVNRERKAIGDISTELYDKEYLSDRLTRAEGDASLLEKLALVSENVQNLVTLEELTDRVQRMADFGLSEEDALVAIARELNCR